VVFRNLLDVLLNFLDFKVFDPKNDALHNIVDLPVVLNHFHNVLLIFTANLNSLKYLRGISQDEFQVLFRDFRSLEDFYDLLFILFGLD
jgi:hypothetical protein